MSTNTKSFSCYLEHLNRGGGGNQAIPADSTAVTPICSGTVPGFLSLATLSRGDCPWFLAFCPNGAQGDSPGQRPVGSNVEITSPRGDCPRFLATVGKTPVTVRRIDDPIARGLSLVSCLLPFAPLGRGNENPPGAVRLLITLWNVSRRFRLTRSQRRRI
jgi:hypothetical protein